MMSEPDEIKFACIGCGTLNAPGAAVCSGCGHRFAGPEGGPSREPGPVMAPAPYEPRGTYRPRGRPDEPTFLGCLAKLIGLTVAAIATLIAFVVAFFLTCAIAPGGDSIVLLPCCWPAWGGLGLVVVFAIWVASQFGSGRDRRR